MARVASQIVIFCDFILLILLDFTLNLLVFEFLKRFYILNIYKFVKLYNFMS
jgi:hypothetical protein